MYIYIYIYIKYRIFLLVIRYCNHSRGTMWIIRMLHLCVMCMHEYYAVLNCWTRERLGYTYTSCGCIVHPALGNHTTLRLSYSTTRCPVISKWALSFKQSPFTYATQRVIGRRTDNSCKVHVATHRFMKDTHSLNIPSFCAHTVYLYAMPFSQ